MQSDQTVNQAMQEMRDGKRLRNSSYREILFKIEKLKSENEGIIEHLRDTRERWGVEMRKWSVTGELSNPVDNYLRSRNNPSKITIIFKQDLAKIKNSLFEGNDDDDVSGQPLFKEMEELLELETYKKKTVIELVDLYDQSCGEDKRLGGDGEVIDTGELIRGREDKKNKLLYEQYELEIKTLGTWDPELSYRDKKIIHDDIFGGNLYDLPSLTSPENSLLLAKILKVREEIDGTKQNPHNEGSSLRATCDKNLETQISEAEKNKKGEKDLTPENTAPSM